MLAGHDWSWLRESVCFCRQQPTKILEYNISMAFVCVTQPRLKYALKSISQIDGSLRLPGLGCLFIWCVVHWSYFVLLNGWSVLVFFFSSFFSTKIAVFVTGIWYSSWTMLKMSIHESIDKSPYNKWMLKTGVLLWTLEALVYTVVLYYLTIALSLIHHKS